MSARVSLAALAVATVALPAAAAAGDGPPLPGGRAVTVNASLRPSVHLFGDLVRARVDVALDNQRIDPSRVRLQARFAPYEPVGDLRVSRRDAGPLTQLRYEVVLRCLRFACTPEVQRKSFRFPEGRLLVTPTGGSTRRATVPVRWPSLEAATRIAETAEGAGSADFEPEADFRGDPAPLPRVSYSLNPRAIAAASLMGALLLAALAGAIVVREVRRRRQPPVEDEAPEVTPLERALALVQWAAERRNGAERRSALEVLAVALADEGAGDLAAVARELAWSQRAPDAPATVDLAARARAVAEGDGRVA